MKNWNPRKLPTLQYRMQWCIQQPGNIHFNEFFVYSKERFLLAGNLKVASSVQPPPPFLPPHPPPLLTHPHPYHQATQRTPPLFPPVCCFCAPPEPHRGGELVRGGGSVGCWAVWKSRPKYISKSSCSQLVGREVYLGLCCTMYQTIITLRGISL